MRYITCSNKICSYYRNLKCCFRISFPRHFILNRRKFRRALLSAMLHPCL